MVVEGAGYALVAGVVGVQAVGVGIIEVGGMLVEEGVEATKGVEVDDGDRPYSGCFDYCVDVGVEVFTTAVGVVFRHLPVFFVGIKAASMYRSEKHYLLIRICAL